MANVIEDPVSNKDSSEELSDASNINNSSSNISNTKDSMILNDNINENGVEPNEKFTEEESKVLENSNNENTVLGSINTQLEFGLPDKPEQKEENSENSISVNQVVETNKDCDSNNCETSKITETSNADENLGDNELKSQNDNSTPFNDDNKVGSESNSAEEPISSNENHQNGKCDDEGLSKSEFVELKQNDLPIEEKALEEASKIDKQTSNKESGKGNSDNAVTVIDSDDDEDPLKGIPGEAEYKMSNVVVPKTLECNTYVIQSDSDSEEQVSNNQNEKTSKVQQNNNDDDDDDVVLIEDDYDKPNVTPNLKSKLNEDISELDEDLQPPHKRSKMISITDPISLSGSSPVGKLTIKDARSLSEMKVLNSFQSYLPNSGMITSSSNSFANKVGKPGPYPIAISPNVASSGQFNQLPKIGPASAVAHSGTAPILGTNPNLLPALTDDMFVLEAPSFIVPYIYEKPPVTNLKDTLVKIKTESNMPEKTVTDETASELEKLAQIKGDNLENTGTKSSKPKRKAKNQSGDDSWDESDDTDDDDSGSESRTKVLIKDAETDINLIKQVIAPPEKIIAPTADVEKKSDLYFESPLGRFFIDIGIDLVQEYVQADLLKIQKRKLRKVVESKELNEVEISITALSKNLEASRKRNAQFHFDLKRCEFCNFKTESALSMAHHYETPHMEKNMYKCNFCSYEVRQTQDILFHMEAVHNIKGRLEKALSYHQCPNCPFEDNGRSKIARHQPVCIKKFRPEVNLCPPNDWEAPAKIPKIKPKHGLVGTATAYQAMAAQAAAQKAALATLQQQQQAARNLLVSNNSNRSRKPQPQKIPPVRPAQSHVVPRPLPMPMAAPRQSLPQGTVLANTYNIVKNNPLVQAQNQKRIPGQPSISITPLPRQVSASNPSVSQINPTNIPKNAIKSGPPGNKSSFVICEICDGYIKDLEQLRNHMQWMHKVKIHPKMIFNRPPLNCQKCQFRFFTDQGLERHLLGSHGLVTSSMQDAANKGKDAGRCPVCGRVYQWKLLNHVSRDHNMTLKPAHLSYKCTVCTATFGMYKEFENHVYTAHSTVAKKSIDMKKGNTSNSNNSINTQRPSGSTCNDSLLRPLRINDEITIIPQGATKKL
ncbi:uncharacterized protein LOC129613441 isoform X2 [Condylostylus longicornis]|uniref:uncharacterized protein LOC129613441 isoform X2 n=1 Tax=Condylostylus longicornis TaxID=2530218 RepID=UPI00244DDFC6|nr:uncharacterized protein LOC129613441 isoform X2 [Condylostylus longicornis]